MTLVHISSNQSALELYHGLCLPDAGAPGPAIASKAKLQDRDALLLMPPGFDLLDRSVLLRLPQILEVRGKARKAGEQGRAEQMHAEVGPQRC